MLLLPLLRRMLPPLLLLLLLPVLAVHARCDCARGANLDMGRCGRVR
jgi:hypothetical protein